MRARRPIAVCGGILALSIVATPSIVETQSASSPDVKAAFLMNFARFVAWSESQLPARRALTIGVLGNNAVADSLTSLAAGKTVDGHPVVVTRISASDDTTKLHVLFIGASERAHVPELIKRLGPTSVLTVSDAARFCLSGGMIQLRNEDDRIRFDINLERAQSAALVINSKLLALAGVVNPKND